MSIKYTKLTKNEISDYLENKKNDRDYIVYIPGLLCKNKYDFFRITAQSFTFPTYFGYNWDSFDECINDLSWLNFSSLIIVLDDFSQLFAYEKEARRVLMLVLFEMNTYWSNKDVIIEIMLNN